MITGEATDDPSFSPRETKKFERALSIAALLTSSHEMQANADKNDDDLVFHLGLCGKSVSRCAERQTGLR